MSVRAIIFDLGGTLWYWPRKNPTRDGRWFWSASYDHCVRLPHCPAGIVRTERDDYARAMVASEKNYRRRAKTGGRSSSPRGIVLDGFRRLGLPAVEQEMSVALESYGWVATGWTDPFRDCHATLSRLKTVGYRLGVLSNTWWSATWSDDDPRSSGLTNLLEEVLYTSDLPCTKPHPSAFRAAAGRLGVGLSECLMVGNDPVVDISGALGSGMYATWKRSGGVLPDGIKPSATVGHPAELPTLLRSWTD